MSKVSHPILLFYVYFIHLYYLKSSIFKRKGELNKDVAAI